MASSVFTDIRLYRTQGRHIYYTDETWVNFGHTKRAIWQDKTITSSRDAFTRDLSTGFKPPSGKGSRLILIHGGSTDGFVNDGSNIFRAQRKHGDYHGEMNGAFYEKWFVDQLLPNVRPNSVIVLDNAPYHSVRLELIPSQSSKKTDIQNWLTEKNIPWRDDQLKAELLTLVTSTRSRYEAYRIDTIAAQHGHTVLRLPPYHCTLNPIEMIWSQIKGFVARENRTFKASEVETLVKEAIRRVTSEHWKNCIDHVIKEENIMWEIDGMAEQAVECLQFSVGDSSDESDY